MMSKLVSLPPLRRHRQLVALALATAAFPAFAQTVSAPLNVTTIAGGVGVRQAIDGSALTARFYEPSGLVFDSHGNLFIADACNNLFRELDVNGNVSTFAGTPMNTADHRINIGSADGTGAAASFYIGQFVSSGLWSQPVVDPNIGAITLGIDGQNNIYFADTQNDTIRMITPGGVVTTIAGSVGGGGNTDATSGGNARFNVPTGVAAAADGTVYVADSGNNAIRKLTASGNTYAVTTFAGGTFGTQNGTGTAAQFANPSGIAIDSSGTLYVTDTANHAIRKITSGGVVTTLAGSPGQRGTSDGTGTQARFNGPTGIALDASGNIYVVDTGNNAIRLISPAGTVTTVAGLKGTAGSADGTGTAARFNSPYGITVRGSTIYISDTGNQTIRQGVASTSSGSLQVTSAPPSLVQVNKLANVTLKIVATGTPSPTYQWSKNGTAIAGATTGTLTLTSVTSADAAAYTVLVTSNQVTFSSSPTTLQVFDAQTSVPVAIVTEPTSQSVALGQSATFTVEASGSGTLAYQWAKNGTAITGATSATYSIASAQASDAANYTVTVTDGTDLAATSDAATLTVTGVTNVAPAFTTQPISATPAAGATVIFTVAATGTPAPTFKWQKDGVDLTNGANISGATTTSLTITSISNSDVGTYRAVATNTAGSTLSNAVTLTIGAPVAPSITTQPSSQVVSAGGTATFTVAASGSPTPTIQWEKNGTAISGATSTTLTLTNVSTADAATYTAVASNAAGTATSNGATLTIGSPSDPGRIINMSVLTSISATENFTFGYVLGGAGTSGTKPILMRAMGPSLTVFHVSPVLPNPYLEFYNGSTLAATNDDWGGDPTIQSAVDAVQAFGFVSTTSKDAATFSPNVPSSGLHSVKVFSHDNGSGSVIAEVYDATSANAWTSTTPRLINVSVLKNVGALTTVGFNITGSTPVKVLVRAVGPSLANPPFNVSGTMSDPKISMFVQGASTPFDSNDDWGGTAALTAAASAANAFSIPANSKDAALLETLQSGGYSVQVTASTGTTGQAIIEVYEVPQ